jgi:D-glycero-alpha-D-manno-heptose 1-phosphate guanylyltransferase
VALIIAGGFGTRLRNAMPNLPKVLARVAQQPFVLYLLDWLSRAQIDHVVMCTGYLGDMVADAVGSHYKQMRITYSHEDTPLGTGGALRLAFDSHDDLTDPVLVMNGDTLADVNLEDLLRYHSSQTGVGTLVVAPVADASRYGTVEMENSGPQAGRILAFREKRPGCGAGNVSAGMYLLNRASLAQIPAGRAVSLEREMFPQWIPAGLAAYVAPEDSFVDIGTPESMAQAGAWLAQHGRSLDRGTARPSEMR